MAKSIKNNFLEGNYKGYVFAALKTKTQLKKIIKFLKNEGGLFGPEQDFNNNNIGSRMKKDSVLTPKQVGKMLDISANEAIQLGKSNKIKMSKISGRYFFDKKEVRVYLKDKVVISLPINELGCKK